jgi:hypothetical protein
VSLEEIKQEIKSLSGEERHELSAFLTRLELEHDSDYWTRIRRRSNDENPDHWVRAEDLATS